MYGADVGLLHSLQSLDREKYHPIVILPMDMVTGMLSSELDRLGVEYHFAHLGILRRKYFSLRAILPLVKELIRGVACVRSMARSRNVALVYVNTVVAGSGAIGGKLAGVPVLWHLREILSVPRPVRWVLYKWLKLCSKRVVCVSNAVRDSAVKEEPGLARKSVVVYNAVTVSESEKIESSTDLRAELGLPPGTRLVGMVGRISNWKGQEILVKASSLVLQSHPDVHFVAVGSYFAGEAHYLEELKDLVRTLALEERFHIVGYRSDVVNVYRTLDVFVLPSIKPEPFGRVTVEAMTQGCAVIATNHGGSCELIEQGVTGMLVPPSDPKSLAEAIEQLLSDSTLRNNMGKAASIYALKNFGLQNYERQMRDIIHELVEAK
jgi:glycosyltransferase involved in cell wall biosynthesis